jgi:hypothetical protein
MDELVVAHGIAQLGPDTDPRSIERTLAEHRPRLMQFAQPLPERLLEAAASALAEFPDVGFRVYGRSVDPSLVWLGRFAHIHDLSIDLWHATSFDLLASFKRLRKLSLGETASRRPSLAFLSSLPEIEILRVEAHDKDFAAVGEMPKLRQLHLRVPRVKTLDPLRGHKLLEVVAIDFGGIRDLTPLGDLPALRAMELYQIRKLDTDDLDAIGDCRSLVALSLGALRNVTRLAALTRGPRDTLRYLTLEQMGGLETLEDLGLCTALEQIHLVESKPKDGRLDAVAQGSALRHLVVGDHYPKEQLEATAAAFHGSTLQVRGVTLRGDADLSNVDVSWRRPVEQYLSLPAATSGD